MSVQLFRVLEADSGYIEIDGVNTSTVGLSLLRSSISIVPQSPELFEGTMRSNSACRPFHLEYLELI
jgi:ATP-binding cassette subfamily C (CFTR/MRP) protein 1